MMKFGMVIDCARQEIYISPNGRNAGTSQHFDVPASINGHATRLIVDTGAITTLLGKEFAVQCGVVPGTFGARRLVSQTTDGRRVSISEGAVKELEIGDFKLANVEVMLAPIDSAVLQSKTSGEANAGLLGEEYLSLNFALIDLGGMSLYLRYPDSR